MKPGKLNPQAKEFVPKKKKHTDSSITQSPLLQIPIQKSTLQTQQFISAFALLDGCLEALPKSQEEEKSREEVELEQFVYDTDLVDRKFEKFLNSSQIICPYYVNGSCKFGKTCKFYHPIPEDDEAPFLSVGNLKVPKTEFEGDHECNICYQKILQNDHTFGLLSDCDHPFCLDCIRKWRSTYSEKTNKQFFRLCPICRKTSFFVIPSNVYLKAGPQKSRIIDSYKKRLQEIPCKYFSFGDDDSCPFGNSCFYAHLDKEGKVYKIPPRQKVVKDDGMNTVVCFEQDIKLSDLISL